MRITLYKLTLSDVVLSRIFECVIYSGNKKLVGMNYATYKRMMIPVCLKCLMSLISYITN